MNTAGMLQCWCMDIRIELYLKGWLFQYETVAAYDHDDRLSFQNNVELREYIVKIATEKMRILYSKQIEKSEGRYEIFVVFPSRPNPILDEDLYDDFEPLKKET